MTVGRLASVVVLSLVLPFALPASASAKLAALKQKPAPAFTLPTLTGTVCSDSLRGRVVYVDFWASWCDPCRRSFPWLKSLHERYANKGLVIVAINLNKTRADADEFLSQYPAPFTVAFDPAGKTAEAFRVAAMPSSFVIGPTGTILYSHTGFDPKRTGPVETLIQEACAR